MASEKRDWFALQEELKRQHGIAMGDLDEFSAFLDAWQNAAQDTTTETFQLESDLTDFEEYASRAVRDFLETDKAKHEGIEASSLGGYECPAVTIDTKGVIQQINLEAYINEDFVVGKTLIECGLRPNKIVALLSLIEDLSPAPNRKFQVLQAWNERTNTQTSIALSPFQMAESNEILFLVLLISPPDTRLAMDLIASKFNLSPTEREIAQSFLDGVPLRDIAEMRGRSYTTIRNQFQKILDKTGCDSQAAFIRLSFSFFQLSQQQTINGSPALHMKTKRMTIPRRGGRTVGLQLSGDEKGEPFLNFSSLFGHGVTPKIDAQLRARNLMMISISRPGFGNTSPSTKGQSLYDCFASDVRVVMDSMELESCPAIARASAARPLYNLLSRLPDRITKGVIVNGMIPRNYIVNKTVISKWTAALMSASFVSFPVAKLILATGNGLLKRSEGSSFLTKMYQESASDCLALNDPNVVASIRQGVEESAKQGLSASAEDMVDGFQDWADDLLNLEVPVTLYHGAADPNIPLEGVREMAIDHCDILQLVEEPDGGGQLCYSHFETILDLAFSKSDG